MVGVLMNYDILQEESKFPYINMSLEEARKLRYLAQNIYAFKDGQLVQMQLIKVNDVIKANGSIYNKDNNLCFDSTIKMTDSSVIFYSEIQKIGGGDFYSVDTFNFLVDFIEVISEIDNQEPMIRKIPYMDVNRELK